MSELTGILNQHENGTTEGLRYLVPHHGWTTGLNIPFGRRIMYVDLKDNQLTSKNFFRVYSIISRERRVFKQDGYPFIVIEISYMGKQDDIEEAMEGLETYATALMGDEYTNAREALLPMLKDRYGY